MYKAIIIDSKALLLKLFSDFLTKNGFEVICEIDDYNHLAERLRKLPKDSADFILISARLSTTNGLESLATIKAEFPELKAIILSAFEDSRHVIAALQLGADGYLVTSCHPEEVVSDIHSILSGKTMVSHKITSSVIRELGKSGKDTGQEDYFHALTPREVEVLYLITKGKTNKEIAETLLLSTNTTKRYVSSIIKKMGARSRTEVVVLGLPYYKDIS